MDQSTSDLMKVVGEESQPILFSDNIRFFCFKGCKDSWIYLLELKFDFRFWSPFTTRLIFSWTVGLPCLGQWIGRGKVIDCDE